MQVKTDTGQTAYTLPSMTIPQPEEDRRTLLLSVGRAVARQTEEETSIESSLSMLQLEDTVDKLLPEPQVNNFRFKPETEIESSEKPDPASYEQQCCKEEPLTKPDMEIQGEIYPPNKENLVHEDTRDDDVPTRRYHTGKAEVDAKAGETRHLPSDPDGITEQATKAEADAKVGQTQHSPANRSSRRTKNKLTDGGNCEREAKQRQRKGQPEGNCTRPPDKTCIWIEY